MYLDFFGLTELPFSIAPDPRYLYMSERHREALAHLLYGVSGQGGFVLLTGEVGTGKTTTCRCFLNQVPSNTDVAFIVNPKLSARELMASICDELHIDYPESASIKKLNDLINSYLLKAHGEGRHTVLIIDEAQNLRVDVLEQLRLLTNLETSEKKLLQIVLLGQPELRELLAKTELRQLAQRITARYHLQALSKDEVQAYVKARLAVAGRRGILFTPASLKKIYQYSKGIPRLINLIADRALLGAYATQSEVVEPLHIKKAYKEIYGEKIKPSGHHSDVKKLFGVAALAASLFIVGVIALQSGLHKKIGPIISDIVKGLPEGQSAALNRDDSVITQSGLDEDEFIENKTLAFSGEDQQNGASNDIERNYKLKRIAEEPANALTKYFAFQSVLKKWHVDYPQEPFRRACDVAGEHGLACLHKEGNWRSLIQLDRPVVLTLVNRQGISFYVSLLSLRNQKAEVSYMGRRFISTLQALDEYWLGEYSIIWKKPPYEFAGSADIRNREEQSWLTEKLLIASDQLPFNESSSGRGELIQPLEKRIKSFQKAVGLEPDGVVGVMTLIKLNSLIDESIPKLKANNFVASTYLR